MSSCSSSHQSPSQRLHLLRPRINHCPVRSSHAIPIAMPTSTDAAPSPIAIQRLRPIFPSPGPLRPGSCLRSGTGRAPVAVARATPLRPHRRGRASLPLICPRSFTCATISASSSRLLNVGTASVASTAASRLMSNSSSKLNPAWFCISHRMSTVAQHSLSNHAPIGRKSRDLLCVMPVLFTQGHAGG